MLWDPAKASAFLMFLAATATTYNNTGLKFNFLTNNFGSSKVVSAQVPTIPCVRLLTRNSHMTRNHEQSFQLSKCPNEQLFPP